MHTTNYYNTFIEVAEDCPVEEGVEPPIRGGKKSIAYLQFEMLLNRPYHFTSDEVLFSVYAIRKELVKSEWEIARKQYFSKGQPCFRASPLTKRYGWGIHSNSEGMIAMYGMDSEAYQQFVQDPSLEKVKAMRSRRK